VEEKQSRVLIHARNVMQSRASGSVALGTCASVPLHCPVSPPRRGFASEKKKKENKEQKGNQVINASKEVFAPLRNCVKRILGLSSEA
jgi:hypothetical protein